jgi:hypothetical protein
VSYLGHAYKEGQQVYYRGNFGTGPLEKVTIESAEDTKNGRAVYVLSNGKWCYESAIEESNND